MDFKMIPLAVFLASYLLQRNVADAMIGVNWGRQNAQKLLPSNVVDLIMQNGVGAARLFTTEEDILQAFAGSGIELTVNILSSNSFKTLPQANSWVQARKQHFRPSNIRQIYLADFAFSMYFNKAIISDAMQSMQSLQEAINIVGYGNQVKVTIPTNKAILKLNNTSLRPSEAEFLDVIKPEMTTFLRTLQQNNAPFVITINPIADTLQFGSDLSFAFFERESSLVVKDLDGAVYTNVFEIMYDSYIWALTKLNASDIRVIVGQVGWPTDGFPGANATTAERFYKGLLPWVSSNKGTPMRPGAPIDIFIQGLTDENKMTYYGDGSFTRHWGIYMSNGRPKYKIDLSGKGRDIFPAVSKGIMRMPDRWCVYNGERANITKVRSQMDIACSLADCTAMAPGGSCSHLDFKQNATYAFNMYFQFQFQNETECDFEGLAKVSTDDPSTPGCAFPVEVVRPEPIIVYPTGKGIFVRPNSATFVILFSMLGTLFWS